MFGEGPTTRMTHVAEIESSSIGKLNGSSAWLKSLVTELNKSGELQEPGFGGRGAGITEKFIPWRDSGVKEELKFF